MACRPEPIEDCPRCESAISTVWTSQRRHQHHCTNDDCGWAGEPFTPVQRVISTTRQVCINHGGWEYELFDQYGCAITFSRSYSTEAECRAAALDDIKRSSRMPNCAPCRAVIWPPTVEAHGTLVEGE